MRAPKTMAAADILAVLDQLCIPDRVPRLDLLQHWSGVAPHRFKLAVDALIAECLVTQSETIDGVVLYPTMLGFQLIAELKLPAPPFEEPL